MTMSRTTNSEIAWNFTFVEITAQRVLIDAPIWYTAKNRRAALAERKGSIKSNARWYKAASLPHLVNLICHHKSLDDGVRLRFWNLATDNALDLAIKQKKRKKMAAPLERQCAVASKKRKTIQIDDLPEKLRKNIQIARQDCWIWRGSRDRGGYGVVFFEKRNWRVHRLTYTLCNGFIPQGSLLMHSCDIRNCCNPEHLTPGSTYQNSADAITKGRATFQNFRPRKDTVFLPRGRKPKYLNKQ